MKTLLRSLLTTIIASVYCSCDNKTSDKFVVAPFTKIDTIATNDWWNRKPNKIIDVKVNCKHI